MSTALKHPPKPLRWSKEFYYQMGELGWFDDKRVELIDGEIYEMSLIGSHHAVSVILVIQALQRFLPDGFFVYPQSPLNSGPRSEPVPDVAVISGAVRDYTESLPQTSALVVEVSDSPLRLDRNVKAKLYASNGIQEYWIVDLNGKALTVHRNPTVEASKSALSSYTSIMTLGPNDYVSPVFAPNQKILVSSVLP